MGTRDWGAAEWSAFSSVGALVVAVIVGGFVAIQVLQAKRLREEQARPYVILDFEFKGWFVHLVVKNIGATPARDVKIEFDKPLEVPDRTRRPNDFEIFRAPIPMIAPGRVIRVRFGAGPDFFKDDVDVPLNYQATVTYSDLHGKKRFDDPPLVLDLLPYKNTVVGADRLAEVAQATKGIERILKRWGGNSDTLKVGAVNQTRSLRKQARVDYWWSVRHIVSERGWRGLAKWHVERLKYRLSL